MSNEDRFWEASIAEAVAGREPPDQSAEILAKLNAPAVPRTKGRLRWLRYPVELAAAAALVLAIGVATGVVKWPWSETEQDPPVDPQRTWAAGPESTVAETPDGLRLENGWLLLKPGAPDVQCGDSRLTDIQGLMLAHAGGEPTEEEFQNVQPWLQQNQVEEAMFAKTKWVAGVAMAVLVLNGSAVLDGQKVEGEARPEAPIVWHRINSAMDLDNLPQAATYIECNGLDGVYLTFMAETKRLQGIRFLHGNEIKGEHIDALAALPDLRVLDLRGGYWFEDKPEYGKILRLPKLRSVGLNLVAEDTSDVTEEEQAGIRASMQQQIETIKQFEQKGVKVEFGLDYGAVFLLDMVFAAFPATESLHLPFAQDAVCKQVSAFKALTRLRIDSVAAGEIGFMFLSKLPKLETITLNWVGDQAVRPEFLHHIGKIASLRTLEIWGTGRFVAKGVLTVIGKMSQLRKLVLPAGMWAQLSRLDGAVVTPFEELDLDEVTIRIPKDDVQGEYKFQNGGTRHPFDVGFFMGAKAMTLHVDGLRLARGLEAASARGVAEFPLKLQTLRLLLTNTNYANEEYIAKWPKMLESYKNLKRIEIGPSLMYGPPDVGAVIAILKKEMADRPEVEIVETTDR